jgi:hypothetical protein
MKIIDVQDGGMARNERYGVVVGVILIHVANSDSGSDVLRGFCRPEKKYEYLRILQKEIVWAHPERGI